MIHIESRPSKRGRDKYDFFVTCDKTDADAGLKNVIEDLRSCTTSMQVMERTHEKDINDSGKLSHAIVRTRLPN